MMTDIIKNRLEELDGNRATLLSHIKGYRSEIEKLESEIKVIDIRMSELELIELENEKHLISCVAAPADNQPTKDYVDEVAEIVEKADKHKKIQFVEPEKTTTSRGREIETASITGSKNGMQFVLMKKNDYGLPNNKNRVIVNHAQLLEIKDIVKSRKQIHFDEFDGISSPKYAILATFLSEYNGYEKEFINVKYGLVGGDGKKYLYWDES